ncbi:MAG: hypothetical protein ACJAYF_001344 [Arenicella sp.]|jgi:hypothetical protein
MLKDINPMSIFLGMLLSQVAAATAAIALIILFFLVYGNEVLVAFFEYPSSILITIFFTWLSIFIGGYCSMLLSKKALVNPLIVGVLNLLLNLWFMYLIDFKYGGDYAWMLIIAVILIIPSSLLGGYAYRIRNQ